MKPEDFGKVVGMGNTEDMGAALDWDSEIEKEKEFVLLPAGEYDFTVIGFERQRFDGSEKMAPCPMAKLTLEVSNGKDKTTVFDRLYLSTKAEWRLSGFFGAIGQKKHGERLRMNWQQVIGSRGRAKVGVRTYNGKDYNEIKSYIYAEDVVPAPKAGSYQAGMF